MLLCDAIAPVLRASPRPSMKVLTALGAGWGKAAQDKYSRATPRFRTYWDKSVQAWLTSDMHSAADRYRYYYGQVGDRRAQLVMDRFLRPGDTYIDIGANFGVHSIYAQHRVGDQGTVFSVEANPTTYKRLAAHFVMNNLPCEAIQAAFGEVPGVTTMTQYGDITGTATIRVGHDKGKSGQKEISVVVVPGDSVFTERHFTGNTVMKVDVEGVEYSVLRGLTKTLSRVQTAYVEVTPVWIKDQGATADDLYRFMADHGFRAFLPSVTWVLGAFAPKLHINPLTSIPPDQHDALFVREDVAKSL